MADSALDVPAEDLPEDLMSPPTQMTAGGCTHNDAGTRLSKACSTVPPFLAGASNAFESPCRRRTALPPRRRTESTATTSVPLTHHDMMCIGRSYRGGTAACDSLLTMPQ